MKLIDWIIIAVVVVIVGLVAWYIHRSKKRGVKCMGCPDGAVCAKRCAGCSGNCCGSAE